MIFLHMLHDGGFFSAIFLSSYRQIMVVHTVILAVRQVGTLPLARKLLVH